MKAVSVVRRYRFENIDVAYCVQPLDRYSGDHCAVVRFTPYRFGLFMADSSRKGLIAQQQVRSIGNDFLKQVREGRHPTDAMRDVARHHVDEDERFTTVLYLDVLLRRNKGVVSVYRAGHELPILISSKTHKSRRLKRPSRSPLPIGVEGINSDRLPNGEINCTRAYEPMPLKVKQGDVIALYSDGITEAVDGSGEECGRDGLERALSDVVRRRRVRSPEDIIKQSFERLQSYRVRDDSSLLVARIL
ncbi:SpoIIE family protein phosphatase [Candidatus Woesearchaeota archaeon]|nr:SpoIIE family protein phosphatase [Candidatus Woesearchaeota archaeon]